MREYKRYAPGMRTGKLTLISREQGGQKWKKGYGTENIGVAK